MKTIDIYWYVCVFFVLLYSIAFYFTHLDRHAIASQIWLAAMYIIGVLKSERK